MDRNSKPSLGEGSRYKKVAVSLRYQPKEVAKFDPAIRYVERRLPGSSARIHPNPGEGHESGIVYDLFPYLERVRFQRVQELAKRT